MRGTRGRSSRAPTIGRAPTLSAQIDWTSDLTWQVLVPWLDFPVFRLEKGGKSPIFKDTFSQLPAACCEAATTS